MAIQSACRFYGCRELAVANHGYRDSVPGWKSVWSKTWIPRRLLLDHAPPLDHVVTRFFGSSEIQGEFPIVLNRRGDDRRHCMFDAVEHGSAYTIARH